MTVGVSRPPSAHHTPILAPAESGPELGPARVGVDAHERARAGADRVDLHQRQVEDEAPDVGRLADLELAVGDQGDVEARAADVGADDVAVVASSSWSARYRAPITPPIGPGDQRARELACASIEIVPPCAAMIAQVEAGAGVARDVAHALELLAAGLGGVGLDQRRVQPREVAPHRIQLGWTGTPAARAPARRPARAMRSSCSELR